jgi:hypothetical protein
MNATCPKCQTENLTTAKFCKKCGSPLGDIADDKLYEIAMEEIENNNVQKGLYARAFSQSEGDKDKTDALYIKFRVQSLQDELVLEAEQERALYQKQISEKIQQEELLRRDKIESSINLLKDKQVKIENRQDNSEEIFQQTQINTTARVLIILSVITIVIWISLSHY